MNEKGEMDSWETMDIEDHEDAVSLCSEDDIDSDAGEFVEEEPTVLNENAKRSLDHPNTTNPPVKRPKWKNTRPIHKMTAPELVEHFVQAYNFALKHKKSTLLPLDPIQEEDMVHIPKFGKHTETSLTRYIRYLVPGWKRLFKAKNANATMSPIVIIICSSALRAVELLKSLKDFQCPIAKLFSRHLSVSEQTEMLTRFCPIAVGTPHRVQKLLELKVLDISNTTHLVLDMKPDSKDFTVLNLKDTQLDVAKMYANHFQNWVVQKKIKIALY